MEKKSAKPKKKSTKVNKKPIKRKDQMRTKKAKEIMLKELILTHGNVTKSCIETGIDRTTYYLWLDKDPKFKSKVGEIPEIRLDFYEEALEKQIEKGNIAGIIFALKAKGKGRGWIERQEINTQIQDNSITADQFSEAWKEVKSEEKCKSKKNLKKS